MCEYKKTNGSKKDRICVEKIIVNDNLFANTIVLHTVNITTYRPNLDL